MIRPIKRLLASLKMIKDEAACIPIVEFVGLKSKMYSYIKNDEKAEKPP